MSKVVSMKASLSDYKLQDGVYLPKDYQNLNSTEHKQLWDKIGETYYDSQKIAQASNDLPVTKDYSLLTGRPSSTWDKLPKNSTFGSILEIGCGYGRIPIYLSKGRNINCKKYYGLDISEPLLHRLLKFKQMYNFFPGAEFNVICNSAELLPLEDNSIDLLISNCVFMHIPEMQLRKLMVEMSRVIKPGGMFIFNHSFHNKLCPSHVIHNWIRRLNFKNTNDIYLRQFTGAEIDQMMTEAGMKAKCPKYIVEATNEYALIPETIKGIKIPFAKTFNRKLKPVESMREPMAYGYSAYYVTE
jgi:arsenite methyltransferase